MQSAPRDPREPGSLGSPRGTGGTHLVGRRAGLLVVLGLDADPHHAGLVHHFLDQLAILANHLPCEQEGEAITSKDRHQILKIKIGFSSSLFTKFDPYKPYII